MRDFRRPVAIISSASFETPIEPARNEVEMLLPVVHKAMADAGLTQDQVGFTVSGSSDYLQGFPFAFVGALDAVGPWPPIRESHLEMDGAFALAEAIAVLQDEDIDTALVYAFARPSRGQLDRTLALQLDPYTVQPLWADTVSLNGLQARERLEKGLWDEKAMAEVVARSMTDAAANEWAIRKGETSVDDVLAQPVYADPLRRWDCAPVSDGAAAMVIAATGKAESATNAAAWITGFEHRIDPIALNARDLTGSPSARAAGAAAGAGTVDTAELHAPFSHQELLLRRELGLGPEQVVASGYWRRGVAGLDHHAPVDPDDPD